MPVLAAATLELNADGAKFERELERNVAVATAWGTAIGTVLGRGIERAVGYVKSLTENAIDQAEAWDKLAQKMGTTVEKVSEYRVAAALAGTGDGPIRSALREVANHAGEAARNVGLAGQAFKAIDLDPKQFGNTADLFDAVILKLNQYGESTERDVLSNKLLGRSFQELQPFAEQLERSRGLARELGLELDSNTSQAASRFKDNLKIAELGSQAMGTRIAVVLLPTLEKLSQFLVDNAKNTERLDNVTRAADAGLKLFATAGAVVYGVFNTLGQVIGGVAAAIGHMVRGEFKEADRALDEVGNSMLKNIGDAARGVGQVWTQTAESVGASAEKHGKKLAAPALAAAENTKRAASEMREAIMRVYDDAADAALADQEIEKRASDAFERRADVAARVAEAQDKLFKGELTENWGDGLGAVEQKTQKVDDVTRQLGLTFSSAFEDAIVGGKGLHDILMGIEQDLIRIAIRKSITEPAANAAASSFSSFLGSLGTSSAAASTNGGFAFADGGRPPLGVASLVGERGPELFVPDTAGTIIPNHGLGNTFHISVGNGADRAAVAELRALLFAWAGPGRVEERSLAVNAELWR